jgi:signal transduction histidine kinase/ActR/RegA family two-component response regulator
VLASSLDHRANLDQVVALARQKNIGTLAFRIDDEAASIARAALSADARSIRAPLVARGRCFGTVTLGADGSARFGGSDLEMVEDLARRAAQAIDTARLYDDARAADQRKDEFLAMLGHELRNPLAPILTALQLMQLRGGTSREQQVIERQVRHMSRLVDDLLDISRITRGKVKLVREVVELAPLVARAAEMASPLLEQRSHVLHLEVPRTGLMVDADPVRLGQVIANLLTNAAKYTPPSGTIRVTGRREGDEVVLAVSDDGIGIPPEALGRIFDLFVQGERRIDRSEGGLGLGLPLAKSLAELHGGTIRARSEGSGQGSTFEVRLPASGREEVAVAAPARRTRALGPQRRILVIDDNHDVAELIGEALRDLGHDVAIAHDGPQALAIAPGFSPDAALVDIGLPVMDGYELAGRLREACAGAPLRLVAVTGYGQDADRRRSREVGFDAHLVKPVGLDDLIASLTEPEAAAARS